jgi:hypothetical protein
MTIILSILAILAIGGLIYMVFIKNKKFTATAETNTNKTTTSIIPSIYQGLLDLNIKAREAALDKEVLIKLESVLDKVLILAEPINLPQNYSELTVSLNRMHVKYIPSILIPYISLDEKDRLFQKETFIAKLSDIESELNVIKEHLDSGNVADFEKMSRFINAMFEKNNSTDDLK